MDQRNASLGAAGFRQSVEFRNSPRMSLSNLGPCQIPMLYIACATRLTALTFLPYYIKLYYTAVYRTRLRAQSHRGTSILVRSRDSFFISPGASVPGPPSGGPPPFRPLLY